jgi:superfamily II DNA helicase RecQ
MVLLHATADGKSLVPLTTSMIQNGVILVLVPLHQLGSDQVDKQLFSIMVLKPIISMSTRKSMHKS